MKCCKNTVKAATNGHLDCLKKLHSHSKKFEWDGDETLYAAENGHLDCLKYACEAGCPIYPQAIIYAVLKGDHFECLKYLHSKGCEWDTDVIGYAAAYGHLNCLKYAHENGCPWHPQTTYGSVYILKLECLFYCLENDCPIDPNTLNRLYNNILEKTNFDLSLFTNLSFRKILLHPRLKNDITVDKYPKFVKVVEDYEEFINKLYTLFESNTNLPSDVIKYKIIKYI